MYKSLSNTNPITLFAGINVIESRNLALECCEELKSVTDRLKIPFVFKASFDKANRSAIESFRGNGLSYGLGVLAEIKETFGVRTLTDIHEPWQVPLVSSVVDILQIPAFLARQTDLVISAASSEKIINIKKPQYMSPYQVKNVVEKFKAAGNEKIIICERGTVFGYDNLVVDILGFGIMRNITNDTPIIFDVTHSLQCRESFSKHSGGRRSQSLDLAKAALATGLAGLFLEVHPSPALAKCDGDSALPISLLEPFLTQIKQLDDLVKSMPKLVIS
jgi:2-dehydro-3-deoxyphosphooctonate aldolase (KDO 8-P synthase)